MALGFCEQGLLVASSEFVLKSSPVRRSLEQRLADDIRSSLTRAGFRDFKIERRAARILVRGIPDTYRAASIVGKVFGIAYAAPVDIVPGRLDEVLQAVVKIADENLVRGESFAIRSRHSTISQLSRKEIETRGGAEVLRRLADRQVLVDLKNPDLLISIDTADDLALIYRDRTLGPGGLPLSSRWRMIVVLDSGVFAILAAVAMMRRGCFVEPFIPTSHHDSEFAEETQLSLAKLLRGLVPRSQYFGYLVDLDASPKIVDTSGSKLSSVRRIAAQFAITNKFRGLVFSDICGDISRVSRNYGLLPTFYPLLGLDSEELSSLCDFAGISKQELNSQLTRHRDQNNPNVISNPIGSVCVDKIPLGVAEVHDHIAC